MSSNRRDSRSSRRIPLLGLTAAQAHERLLEMSPNALRAIPASEMRLVIEALELPVADYLKKAGIHRGLTTFCREDEEAYSEALIPSWDQLSKAKKNMDEMFEHSGLSAVQQSALQTRLNGWIAEYDLQTRAGKTYLFNIEDTAHDWIESVRRSKDSDLGRTL